MKKLLFVAITALVLSVAALPATAQYDPMFITVTPTTVESCGTDTGTVAVNAGYFTPGTNVVVTLQSDPVTLGTVVATQAGTITATYNLPANITAGAHTVTATGTSRETGLTESVTAAITVTIPAGCVSNQNVTSSTAAPATTGGGSLPRTGGDFGIVAAVGAVLLVAGGLIVMANRKRSAA